MSYGFAVSSRTQLVRFAPHMKLKYPWYRRYLVDYVHMHFLPLLLYHTNITNILQLLLQQAAAIHGVLASHVGGLLL